MQEERRWDSQGAAPGQELGSELEADSGREWLRAEGRSQEGARGDGGVFWVEAKKPEAMGAAGVWLG